MPIKIKIGEAIKRVGSERTYRRWVKSGKLPIHREKKAHPYHTEADFETLNINLERDSASCLARLRDNPRHRRRLTAVEKIMLS